MFNNRGLYKLLGFYRIEYCMVIKKNKLELFLKRSLYNVLSGENMLLNLKRKKRNKVI